MSLIGLMDVKIARKFNFSLVGTQIRAQYWSIITFCSKTISPPKSAEIKNLFKRLPHSCTAWQQL